MIRGVRKNDSERLHLLFKEKHKNIACKFIHPDIHESRIETFVFEENAEVKGMIVITRIKYSTNPYGTIEELIVKSPDEKHIIEKALLKRAMKWFDKSNIRRVFVFAETGQGGVLEGMGFKKSDKFLYYKELNK